MEKRPFLAVFYAHQHELGEIMGDESPQKRPFIMINPDSEYLSSREDTALSATEAKRPPQTESKMEEERSTETRQKKSPMLWIGGLVVLILIGAGLFLPPISLGNRLFGDRLFGDRLFGGNAAETATTEGGTETVAAVSTAPAGVTVTSGTAVITVEPAPAAPPTGKTTKGTVYAISEGSGTEAAVSLPIPADANPQTVDVYGWDGTTWTFVPSSRDTVAGKMQTMEGTLPQALAMMESSAAPTPIISTDIQAGQSLPTEMLPYIQEIILGTKKPAADGALEGDVADKMPEGGYEQYLTVSNRGAIIDLELLASILTNPAVQSVHVATLVAEVTTSGYAGVNLDYQGVSIADRDSYTSFVNAVTDAMHAQNKKVIVTLPMPFEVGEFQWDTVNYDWSALGKTADAIYMEMPLDPTAYGPEGEANKFISWATGYVPREKLSALLTASAIDRIGESYIALPNADALSHFGELEFVQGSESVEAGTPIEVVLSGTATALEWDGESQTYKYSYEENGQTHHVWLNNASALAARTEQLNDDQLRGTIVRSLTEANDVVGYATAIANYMGQGDAPQPASAAIIWTVSDQDENVVASATGESLTFAWEGTETPGTYTVKAEFAMGENVSVLNETAVVVEEEVVIEEVVIEEVIVEEETPVSGTTNAVTIAGANLRQGPGIIYGTIAGGINPGIRVEVIARDGEPTWFKIIIPNTNDEKAWIYNTLIDIDAGVDIAALPINGAGGAVAVGDGGDAGGSDGGGGTTAPPPVNAPPVANGSFELGGQTHGFANPSLMSYAGMNWVKFQHKWGESDNAGDLAGRINQAHANGFKVLLSIPGAATYPTSINFAGYVSFVGQVAALSPDAIEIWNEENIDFEWPAGQIDPASYVNNMLAPAYNAIKAANPNVMVIGGAMAPTGYFGGGCSPNGCDDSAYLAGMAAAGAANYMDCMGVHYNAGATSPTVSSGHPAGGGHYSWYLQPMINTYSVLGKPLCFTELGYLSGEDFGGVPSRFSWAGSTTVNQHAQWLAEAVSIAANSGRVRLAIIFNVDFTTWGDDPQAGYAMMRPNGGCPSCETLRAVMGK